MPRRLRLRLAGQPLHLMQRGVNRAACFAGVNDRLLYLSLLEETAARYDCAIHAYVLMTNHVHLLVTPEQPGGASSLMKNLGQRYVQAFNRRHQRTGTLWDGRFRSSLVQSARYLLTCYRYIEMNPVRAGMVSHPMEYPWSSYANNALGQPSSLLRPHDIYLSLAGTESERLSSYRALFEVSIDESELKDIRESINAGAVLGTKGFIAEVGRRLGRRVTAGKSGKPRPPSQECSSRRETGV